MLAGDEERFLLTQSSKKLVQGVELAGLRQVGKIPGMKDEVWLSVQRVDFIHCGLESSVNVGTRSLVEPDVTVANLYKSEVLGFGLWSSQQAGSPYTAREAPHHSCSSPLHAFQKAAPVDVAVEDVRRAFQVVFGLNH